MGTRARIATGMSRLFSKLAREGMAWPAPAVVALFLFAAHCGSAAEPVAGESRYSLSNNSSGSRYSLGTPSSGDASARRYSLTNQASQEPARDIRFGIGFRSELAPPPSIRTEDDSAELLIQNAGSFAQSVFEQVETGFVPQSDEVGPAEWVSSDVPNDVGTSEIEAVSYSVPQPAERLSSLTPVAESEPQTLPVVTSAVRELAPSPQPSIALPAVRRIAQTTTLRLDPAQAAFLGGAIVLFLLSQTAIVWALRKQAIAVSLSRPGDGDDALGRHMAGFLRPFITTRRDTAVFDFNNDPSLITDGPATSADQWQAEEEALRRHEQMIIEEVVSVNVALGPDLSQG